MHFELTIDGLVFGLLRILKGWKGLKTGWITKKQGRLRLLSGWKAQKNGW